MPHSVRVQHSAVTPSVPNLGVNLSTLSPGRSSTLRYYIRKHRIVLHSCRTHFRLKPGFTGTVLSAGQPVLKIFPSLLRIGNRTIHPLSESGNPGNPPVVGIEQSTRCLDRTPKQLRYYTTLYCTSE